MENKQPLKMNIDIESAEDVICPYCELHLQENEPSSNIFIQAFMVKKIPALQSPTGKEALVPIPIFICQTCGQQLVQHADE